MALLGELLNSNSKISWQLFHQKYINEDNKVIFSPNFFIMFHIGLIFGAINSGEFNDLGTVYVYFFRKDLF